MILCMIVCVWSDIELKKIALRIYSYEISNSSDRIKIFS